MVTQAIKSWLRKLLAWWPWRQSTQIGYHHVTGSLNKGTTQGAVSHSTIDGVASHPGMAQRRSTIEEWPEPIVQPPSQLAASTPPPLVTPQAPNELSEIPLSPPLTSPIEHAASVPTYEPTSEHHLEFLHYLVKRGIVNEGFEDGKIPKQYRRAE
jgi:hypothetical protein